MGDFSVPFTELHEFLDISFLQPVKVPLLSSSALST